MQREGQWEALADLSDEALAERCRDGDEDAFRLLMDRFFLLLKKRAADHAVIGAEAEDLVQEGLMALHQAARTYQNNGQSSFRHYADVCICNRMRSVVRHVFSGKNKVNALTAPMEEAEEVLAGAEEDPQDILIRQEELSGLEQYLQECLTSVESRVLACYLTGMSYDAMAEKLSISRKSCDNAMQRVRRKIRQRYKTAFGGEE